MGTLYTYLLVSIIVGTYTYYDTKNYPEKSSRMTHVVINMVISVIIVMFGFMLVEVINYIWNK